MSYQKNCCRKLTFLVASFIAAASVAATGVAVADGNTAPEYSADQFSDLQWRLVGPFRAGWSEMVEGVPGHADRFYFGASGGGVWRTDDAGQSWTSLFDQGASAPVGAIAVAPSDPETIYIGTGQPEPRYDVAAGAGVFATHDGGKTWTSLGLQDTRYIGRIWVHPTDANTVLVAAVGHFFGPHPDRGVFRSTDGGKSWAQVLKIDDNTGAVDLAADPNDPQTLIAASWQARQFPWQSYFQPVAGAGSGLHISRDGGVTWSPLAGEGWPAGSLGRISVATTRTASGLRIYATVDAAKAGGLYRSDDAGAHWQRVNDEQAFVGNYFSRITVAPNDPDVVYTIGQSIRRCGDGGKSCQIIKGAPGGDDYHFLWINPAHPDHMAAASDQGTTITVNGGLTWSSWYNQPTGQFYHLATDNRFPYRIYSGQQDSGTVAIASRSDYGSIGYRDWHPVGGDERDYDVPDPTDPNIVYSTGLGGRLSRYDAATGEAANITPFPVANYGQRQTSTAHHFVWVTPMAISQAGPTTLYVGAEVVFASTDRGQHWSTISPDLTGKAAHAQRCRDEIAVSDAKACGYGTIWSIGTSRRNAGELWIGTDSGLIQLTRDGGAHWRDVTPKAVPEWAKVSNLDVSALQDGVAYAAIDNQRQDDFQPRVLKTRDYGASWQEATGDLPRDHFVSVVRADPLRAGLLYAGTDIGVLVSVDDGAHWLSLQHNLPTAKVTDLAIHGSDLIAATQGRAIWVLDDVSPLRQVSAVPAGNMSPHLFAPAVAYRLRGNNNRDTPLPPSEPVGQNPPAGASIDYWLPDPVTGPLSIEIRDAKGLLVNRLTSEIEAPPAAEVYFAATWLRPAAPLKRAAGMHRAIWNLRYPRPQAIRYEYSIAAVFGADTAVKPQGSMVLPGTYQLTLKAGGSVQHAQLRVLQDPRSHATLAQLQASQSLSQRIGVALARARRGYGESAAVNEQLHAILAELKTRPTPTDEVAQLSAQLSALITQTERPKTAPSFDRGASILAAIATDLEETDLAPTEPQQQVAADAIGEIDKLWRQWTQIRARGLKELAATLRAHGRSAVLIPAEDKLIIKPPEGGADLP